MTTLLERRNVASVVGSRSAAVVRCPKILNSLLSTYVALLPFQIPVNHEMSFAPADIFLFLILVLAPGQLKYRKAVWTIWHLTLLLVFAIASFVTALSVGSLSSYVWLNKDVGLLFLILGYAAITSAAAEWDQVRRLLRVFTLSIVVQNQVALVSFLWAYSHGVDTLFTMYGGRRLAGMLLDPNAYGGLLALALAICEGASWGRAPLFRRVLLLYCRLNLALGLLFTFSRSAWISLFVPLLLLCAFRRTKAIQLALAGLIAAPCLLLFMGTHLFHFVENMAARPERGVSRLDLIWDAWAQFAQHPFLGGGLGSFLAMEGTYVHNTAVWFLADFGIVGLAALLGFLGWFLIASWSAYRHAPVDQKPVVLALMMGHALMLGLSMGIEAFYQRHWWLVLALIASSLAIAGRQARMRIRHCSMPTGFVK